MCERVCFEQASNYVKWDSTFAYNLHFEGQHFKKMINECT